MEEKGNDGLQAAQFWRLFRGGETTERQHVAHGAIGLGNLSLMDTHSRTQTHTYMAKLGNGKKTDRMLHMDFSG